MKSTIIKVTIFLLGGGLGFLVGKKVYEGYYANVAQEEIDSVKESFEARKPIKSARTSKFDEIRSNNGMTDELYEKRKEVRSGGNASLTRSSLDDNPNERAKRNYNLFGANDSDPETESDYEDDDGPVTDEAGKSEEEMSDSEDGLSEPYLINDMQFSDENQHYDKVSLYYYKLDDILCEEEEILDDIEETIGYEAMTALDNQTTVWVRNERLEIDYEVISINKSYAEAVEGLNIAPAKNLSPREQYEKERRN